MKKESVTLLYCNTCKGICFNYTQRETHYVSVSYTIDIDAKFEEVCTNKNDSEEYETYCDQCGDPLSQEITISKKLYQKIYTKVCEEAEHTTVNIFKCDMGKDISDLSDLSVEDTELRILEALL